MSTITLTQPAGEAVATQAVALRAKWSDPWVTAADLHCTRLSASTCETLSNAAFHYRFGSVLQAGGSVFTTKPVTTINPLHYVRVVIAGTGGRTGYTWYGVWRAATKSDTAQQFSAVGLESLLDNPCVDAPYWDGASVRWAGRGLRFNARGLPNRSAAKHAVHGQSVYTFDGVQTAAEYWTTRDAVETLLAMAAPIDAAGAVIFNWTPANLAALPNFDRLQDEATHGASFLNLLRAFVPRHRLIGWGVRAGTGNTVEAVFDTFTAAAISLTDAAGDEVGTIPANSAQDAVVITADQSATASLSIEASNVADQVIATGARRRTVFSLSKLDNNLHGLWRSADETDYLAGASAASDYPPATEPRLREERDRQARASDRFRHVYAQFGPAFSWDQLAGDGYAGEDQTPIALVDEDADEPTQFKLLYWELEFDERLPLLTGYAYEDSKIADREDDPGHHGDVISDVHEPLPTLAFVQVVEAVDDPDGTARWTLADQLGRTADLEQPDGNTARRWSAEARAVRDLLALEIRVQGEAQHVLAATETLGESCAIAGAIGWDYDLIVTVCLQDLRDTEVRYPADEDVVCYGELVRRLRIEAPQYEFVRVLPNTVVGVNPVDQTLFRTDGGILIDDRPQLRLLAQRTYEWHRQPRYALQLSTGWIDGALGVGHLITSLTDASGTWPVNSVITEITLEFPVAQATSSPRPTLTIATSFAEMDPAAIGRI